MENLELRTCKSCGRSLVLCRDNFEHVGGGNFRRVCRDCKNAEDLSRKLNDPESREKHLTACKRYHEETKKSV